ncbi:MAG TPA: HNH endonuclease [Gammaproteobacteria bacterium]|nr:HNH endonuclease [Gammaproteobacteria bacterium]
MTPELINEAALRVLAQCIRKGECLEWQGNWTTHNGYGRVTFKQKKLLAHRIAYEAYKGPVPSGMQVMHSCDNRRCCNPDHLSVGTGQDNTNDRKAKDRMGFKLTTADVVEIKRLCQSGISQTTVANQFGVLQSQVSRIMTGKRWFHLIGGIDSQDKNPAESMI